MRVRGATPIDAEAFVVVPASAAEENRWITTEPGFDVEERAARGRGGGRLLVDALLRHVATTDELELEVWPDNGRAICL